MDTSSEENSAELARQRNFETVFGVTEADLRERAIDPDEYAAANIHDALKDPTIRAQLLSPSMNQKLTSDRRGLGAYLVIFVGFGFLFLSLVRPLHWFGIVAAAVSEVVAVTMFVVAVRDRRRARALRHGEESPID